MLKTFIKTIVITILTWEARLVLRKYKPRIVAVTGNAGKTSTKDAIFTVLSGNFFVRKSEKSFNSEIGVPLTILGCQTGWSNPLKWAGNILEGLNLIVLKNHYPRVLVLEVGADRPGDIARVARWLQPGTAVLTGIGEVPVHVEFFASSEELAKEKAHLIRAVSEGGLAVVYGDDKRTHAIADSDARARVVFFGKRETNNFYISNEQIIYGEGRRPEAINFKINTLHASVPVTIHGTAGLHLAESALAAAAVGVAHEMNLVDVAARLSNEFVPQPGRMRIVAGKEGSTILDDTYNASPAATESALKSLEALEAPGRRIAILGDMMELGAYSADAHTSVGVLAARASDLFVAVGPRMKMAVEAAAGSHPTKDKVKTFGDAKEAGDYMAQYVKPGDTILVKGSQSMRMERVVEAIMAEPERRSELLVRQEAEWRAKS